NNSTFFGTLDLAALTANQTYSFPDATGTVCISGQTCATSGIVGLWQRNNGALTPANVTDDILLGSTSTSSARFAFTNVAGGTPTASISGASNNALSLTLGGTSTGDIVLSGRGGVGANGIFFAGYGTGLIHSDSTGRLTSSLVNLN